MCCIIETYEDGLIVSFTVRHLTSEQSSLVGTIFIIQSNDTKASIHIESSIHNFFSIGEKPPPKFTSRRSRAAVVFICEADERFHCKSNVIYEYDAIIRHQVSVVKESNVCQRKTLKH